MVLIAWNKGECLLCNALHYKYKATLEQEKSGNEGKQMSEGKKKVVGREVGRRNRYHSALLQNVPSSVFGSSIIL